MNEKFLIHVEIGDRPYPLRIKRDEEELVREAVRQIQILVKRYRDEYAQAGLETKDLLAMAALQFSKKNLQLKDKNNTDPFTNKLQQLTDELEIYLGDKK